MSISERIMHLRKQHGWSQEELADRLGVSRQSVSKWESGISNPDLDRIIALSDLFGVTTDHLLRGSGDPMTEEPPHAPDVCLTIDLPDDPSPIVIPEPKPERADDPSLLAEQEVYAFIAARRTAAGRIALSTAGCVLSPAPTVLLDGLGVGLMLLIIAVCVAGFIAAGMQPGGTGRLRRHSRMSPAMTEWVEEERLRYRPVFARNIAIGVALCILSSAPIVIMGDLFSVAMLFVFVALGVYLFVHSGMISSGYTRLLWHRAER